MITPSDKHYIETKKIKMNHEKINFNYCDLADYVKNKFNVKVLNVIIDYIEEPEKRPRLSIVLERTSDYKLFYKGSGKGFDATKQEDIKNYFKNTELSESIKNLKSLFVVFEDFEEVARLEVSQKISMKELNDLIFEDEWKYIWKVEVFFSELIIFFNCDKDIKKYASTLFVNRVSCDFLDLQKKYDDFNYCSIEKVYLKVDSKENLDKNYNGSLFNYYR